MTNQKNARDLTPFLGNVPIIDSVNKPDIHLVSYIFYFLLKRYSTYINEKIRATSLIHYTEFITYSDK